MRRGKQFTFIAALPVTIRIVSDQKRINMYLYHYSISNIVLGECQCQIRSCFCQSKGYTAQTKQHNFPALSIDFIALLVILSLNYIYIIDVVFLAILISADMVINLKSSIFCSCGTILKLKVNTHIS